MININKVTSYCCEDISLIENYDKAINDKTQVWHCHHKAETLPCGRFSRNDLKKFNLYYNRPANELIFLRPKDHKKLHQLGKKRSEEVCRKISESLKGKTHSKESKKKMSKSHKGIKRGSHSEESKLKISKSLKGRIPWNKGKTGIYSDETKLKMSERLKLSWKSRL